MYTLDVGEMAVNLFARCQKGISRACLLHAWLCWTHCASLQCGPLTLERPSAQLLSAIGCQS